MGRRLLGTLLGAAGPETSVFQSTVRARFVPEFRSTARSLVLRGLSFSARRRLVSEYIPHLPVEAARGEAPIETAACVGCET